MSSIREFFTSPAGILCLLALLLVVAAIAIVKISSRRKNSVSNRNDSVVIGQAPEEWVQQKPLYAHTGEPVRVKVLSCVPDAPGKEPQKGDLPVYRVQLDGYPGVFMARQDPKYRVFLAQLLEAKETGEQIPVIMQNDWIYVW